LNKNEFHTLVLRPGRIDHHIELTLPDNKSRTQLFENKLNSMPIAKEIDISELVNMTDGCSMSEIDNLCRESAMVSLRENMENTIITREHFQIARKLLQHKIF
jgi:transitional endoplasmic reticulum ATPase